MQRFIFLAIVVLHVLDSFGQDKPKIIHITTNGNFINDSLSSQKIPADILKYETIELEYSDIKVFSLVDSVGFNNFKNYIKKIKTKSWKTKFLLVAVSEKDSMQKLEFMMSFYRNQKTKKSIRESYLLSAKEIKSKFKDLDFKHKLIKE